MIFINNHYYFVQIPSSPGSYSFPLSPCHSFCLLLSVGIVGFHVLFICHSLLFLSMNIYIALSLYVCVFLCVSL